MRKILRGFIGVPATLLAVAIVAAGALFAYLRWRDSQAASFASSVVAENSPIAEFASRRIVWKVVRCDSSVSSDTMRETVYTIKAGYDLTKADPPVVDPDRKTVVFTLPAPKIISVDHFLQRASTERATFAKRVFGSLGEDGRADREDAAQLAADCERFGLLSAADLREGIARYMSARLSAAGGYSLEIQSGLDIPAKVMFNAYFEEKGVDFRLP